MVLRRRGENMVTWFLRKSA